ncbi:MAG TPA: PEGA domain-containing protein [Methanoregulaceae archaeon]|nr:PEGA domain-containing protein [Methanoregulaceae archaeon]
MVIMMKTITILAILLILGIAGTGIVLAADTPGPAIGGDTGYYALNSDPSGATAMVDGNDAGITPTVYPVYTTGSPGHTIAMTLSGYQPWSQYYAVNPPAGGTITVNAVLVPIPVTLPTTPPVVGENGYYYVSANVPGASVSLDNTNYGVAPVTIAVSTSGTPGHTISVAKPGYQTWSQFYPGNPPAGQTINVYATLTPNVQTGTIYVTSNPSGATAILDNGYDQGTTPMYFYSVPTGSHNIRVTSPGYQQYSTNIVVSPGATSNVYATLTPNQQSGSISVSSVPTGAGLYVDTIYQGETNQIVGNLAVGSHTVTLKETGYQTWQSTVTVNYGQTTYITVTLVPLQNPTTGDLSVTSAPSGAAVYVNGNYQGTTSTVSPLDVTGLQPGTVTVVLKKSGYNDYTTTANIVSGTSAQVSATLQPAGNQKTSNVQITSDPSGADVYVNNVYKGITPLSFQNVPAGTGTVTISLPGYNTYTTTVTLAAGQDYQVNAALTPQNNPAPPAGISTIVMVVGAVLVIAAIIVIAYAVMQRKKPEEPGQP